MGHYQDRLRTFPNMRTKPYTPLVIIILCFVFKMFSVYFHSLYVSYVITCDLIRIFFTIFMVFLLLDMNRCPAFLLIICSKLNMPYSFKFLTIIVLFIPTPPLLLNYILVIHPSISVSDKFISLVFENSI